MLATYLLRAWRLFLTFFAPRPQPVAPAAPHPKAPVSPWDPRIDEIALYAALLYGLTLRTRDGHRARVTRIDSDADEGDDIYPVHGAIELVDDHNGTAQWWELSWFSDGAHTLYEHAWDLVSVETNECLHCGCNEFDACVTSGGHPCHWVVFDRDTHRGVCSACAQQVAA